MKNVKKILEKALETYDEVIKDPDRTPPSPMNESIYCIVGGERYKVSICKETTDDNQLKIVIRDILRKLRVPAHLTGFDYLVDAIAMTYLDKENITHITKTIYPEIAKARNTSPSRVERCIRHAVSVTLFQGSKDMIFQVFYEYPLNVTNSNFIASVTNYLIDYLERD